MQLVCGNEGARYDIWRKPLPRLLPIRSRELRRNSRLTQHLPQEIMAATEINLNDMSDVELKALAYDVMAQIELLNQNFSQINQVLMNRKKAKPEPVQPTESTL